MNIHTKTLIAIVGMIVGVAVSEKTVYGSEVAIGAFLLGVVQLTIYFFERRALRKTQIQREEKTNNKVSRFSIPLASGIFFIAIALLILRMQFSVEKNNFVCEKVCSFNATLTSSPSIKNEYQVFSVRPETEHTVYDIQVKVPLYPRFEVGDKITLTGKVTLPYVAMPHDGNEGFDYETYLRVHDIGSEMLYPKVVPLESSSESYGFVTKLERVREYFVRSISLYVGDPASSLASGMLLGESTFSKELTQTFRTSGISHIVVLSGFNVAILISFVLSVFVFVPLFLRIFCAGILVIFFVLMVGGEASIVRATIMSFIGLTALFVGRAYLAKQALLLSLIGISIYEPIHLLHDVSLHLSFLATAGIVYMSDGVKNVLQKIHSKTYQEIIATTVCAYLATLPYVMFTFGSISLYALLANFIVLPFVPIMMLVTFLTLLSSGFSGVLALLFGYVDTLLGDVIIFVARSVERLPFSLMSFKISFTSMCFIYAVIIFVYSYIAYRFSSKKPDETSPTKNDEIWSGVISY